MRCVVPIDLAEPNSYGQEILAILRSAEGWLADYYLEEKRLNALPLACRVQLENQWSNRRRCLIGNDILPLVSGRSILGWHYTRLMDCELDELRQFGIKKSNCRFMLKRLGRARRNGALNQKEYTDLKAGSPLNCLSQRSARSNKFYIVSKRHPPCDSGVKLLLSQWGGEVINFCIGDPTLQTKVESIGKAAILEVSVPVSASNLDIKLAESVVDRLTPGHKDAADFDISVECDLPPSCLRDIILESDQRFPNFGR